MWESDRRVENDNWACVTVTSYKAGLVGLLPHTQPESRLSFKKRVKKKKDNAAKKPNLTSLLLNIYQRAALSDLLHGISRRVALEMGQLVSAISFGVSLNERNCLPEMEGGGKKITQ